jgi:putative ATP-binding cassette transporter
MVSGSLRDQFRSSVPPEALTDERIADALHTVGLVSLIARSGGLDVVHDWATALSLGEQQLLAFARLLLAQPDFAFLDHATSALSDERQAALYQLLAHSPITYVSVGDEQRGLREHHDTQLELRSDGSWSAAPIRADATG